MTSTEYRRGPQHQQQIYDAIESLQKYRQATIQSNEQAKEQNPIQDSNYSPTPGHRQRLAFQIGVIDSPEYRIGLVHDAISFANKANQHHETGQYQYNKPPLQSSSSNRLYDFSELLSDMERIHKCLTSQSLQ